MARERLLRAEIEALPFAPDSFDAVAATGVLEYADITRAVSELARVLRPGGIAVLSYPNPTAIYGVWKTQVWYRATRFVKRVLQRPHPDLPRGAGRIPPERFEQLLRGAGLESEAREYSSYLPMVTRSSCCSHASPHAPAHGSKAPADSQGDSSQRRRLRRAKAALALDGVRCQEGGHASRWELAVNPEPRIRIVCSRRQFSVALVRTGVTTRPSLRPAIE